MSYRVSAVALWIVVTTITVLAQDPTMQSPTTTIDSSAQMVSGTVVTSDGHPATNARIDAINTQTGQIAASAYTNSSGAFSLAGIGAGEFEIVATMGLSDARERVSVSHREVVNNIRLQLPDGQEPSVAKAGNQYSVSVAQMKVPDKARKAYERARKALDRSEVAEATKADTEALAEYPDYADALTLRGIIELDAHQTDKACADLEKAVSLDPSNGMNSIALGAAYNILQRYDDAQRVLQRGIASAPQAWQGYYEMGKAYVGQGKYEDALAQLGRATDLAPKMFAAIHLVKAHAFLSLKNYDQSMLEMQQYLDQAPKGPDADQVRDTMQRVRAFAAVNPGSK